MRIGSGEGRGSQLSSKFQELHDDLKPLPSSILFQGLLARVGEFFIKYRFLHLFLLLGCAQKE